MIAEIEWTQSNAQQNIEHVQNPTIGETINNESTAAYYGFNSIAFQ